MFESGKKRPLTPYSAAITRCDAGITTVEFALIAPVFLIIMLGVVEFSLITFATSLLEGSTTVTARVGKTGYITPGSTRQEEIIKTISEKTSGLLDPAKITITTKVYTSFDKIGQPEPCIKPPSAPCSGVAGVNFVDTNGNGAWDSDMGSAGLGNAGDIVVYTVSYPWNVMTPIISTITGNPYIISARTVVRNEPYSVGAR